ncbi:MAG TPA: hypothetical protein VIV11_16480 [Kofleriaceae bacterium]
MANRRAMKLFAVTMLAGTHAAYASPATQVATQGTARAQEQTTEKVDWASYLDGSLTASFTPRVLRSGRPAAGNTIGKTPPPDEEDARAEQESLADALAVFEAEERKAKLAAEQPRRIVTRPNPITKEHRMLLAAQREYAAANAIEIKPRVYANFRPACGNTGGKVERPSDCTGAEVRAAYAYDKEYTRLAHKRDQKAEVAYKKLLDAREAAFRADPSLEARLYDNGRPACGNTMSKARSNNCSVFGDDQ